MTSQRMFLILLLSLTVIGSQTITSDDARYVRDSDTGITLLEGFEAELIYDVPKSQGSWVAMAFIRRCE